MGDAAVGSISHILKTAFKDVYDEKNREREEKAAREAKIARRREKAVRRKEVAEKRAELERILAERSKEKKSTKGGDDKERQMLEELEDPSDDSEDEAAPTQDKTSYSDINQRKLEEKIAAIERRTREQSEGAEELVKYLHEQRILAQKLETEEEEHLKKQGIMLGQHIPSLPSKLDIDPAVIHHYDTVSSNLILSRDLVQQNKDNALRRTGNKPISDLAEQMKTQRRAYREAQEDQRPHYLQETSVELNRTAVNRQRFKTALELAETKRRTERPAKDLIETKKKQKKHKMELTLDERIKNEEILKSMNHKMNYLRNPRNNPAAVTKMLNRNAAVDDADSSVQTSRISRHSHVTPASQASRNSKPADPAPLFVTEPRVISFNAYEIGESYVTPVVFRNVSSVSRSLRVIPPASTSFSLGPLVYPSNSKAGIVAPGMCITSEITFYPKSLMDYTDHLLVETEGGNYVVDILAQRLAPVLNLPSVIDVGSCLVGDALRVAIPCTNIGGHGKIRVLRDQHSTEEMSGCLRMPPFTVYPLECFLKKNESLNLTVEFVPLQLGVIEQPIYFVMDNGSYLRVVLHGHCREVVCDITEINGTKIIPSDPNIVKDLYFPGTCVGSEAEQQFVVTNTTGLPMEYEWVWIDANAKDVSKAALEALMEREAGGNEIEFDFHDIATPSKSRDITALSKSFDVENSGIPRTSVYGFDFYPSRGVFPPEGFEVFTVKYKPQDIAATTSKAVLILKDITRASMRCEKQQKRLASLLENGHGSHHRLRSWLEEMGEVPPTHSYALVNLTNVMSIIRNHGDAKDDLIRILYCVQRLIVESKKWLNQDQVSLADDDHSVASNEERPHGVTFTSYSWEGGSDTTPVLMPEYFIELPSIITDDMVDTLQTPEDREYMHEIWLSIESVLKLMGETICAVLNDKVQHEAVDYIQKISRIRHSILHLNTTGVGYSPFIKISPPRVLVGGLLGVGCPWRGQITVHNASNVVSEVTIDTSTISLVSSSLPVDAPMDEDYLGLAVSPHKLILMPNTSEVVDIELLIHAVGVFEIQLPIIPKSQFTRVDDIYIVVETVGPRIRFELPELDIGLFSTGMEARKMFTFSNDSSIPLKFSLSSALDSQLQLQHSSYGYGKSSRPETARSTMSSGSSVPGSTDSYNIDHPTAQISFDPPQGDLAANATITATLICKAGKLPQRIRGQIECSLVDNTGRSKVPSQFLRVRGEVQSPKTVIYPASLDIGSVYVGVPVKVSITIHNLTNLPSKYKFERPGGDSAAYTLKYDRTGTLDAQERREIVMEFTAVTAGILDDVIGCKIFGTSSPIGFTLKAVSKGVMLEFLPLEDGAPLPEPIASANDVQFPGAEAPVPAVPLPLEFGNNVELYERRVKRFAIRNLSPIPAKFDIYPKKYSVGDILMSTYKEETVTELQLTSQEKNEEKFHSEAGKKYITTSLNRQRDKKYLTLGLGASYDIEPKCGTVSPWGVTVVTVMSRNDMPGCFDDDLVVDVREHRKLHLPVHLTVFGCPLVIERDSYGMSVMDDEKLMLQMGNISVNSELIAQEFRVRNNGSSTATLKWKVRSVSSKVNGPIKVELRRGGNVSKKINCKLLFWDDVAKDVSYAVEPKAAHISPYSKKTFKVKLLRTDHVGVELALLSGSISFDADGLSRSLSTAGFETSRVETARRSARSPEMSEVHSSTSLLTQNTGRNLYSISLHLQTVITEPMLRFNKTTITCKSERTIVPPSNAISLKTSAPLLFAQGLKPSEVCKKRVLISNPLRAVLSFGVSVEGPFTIKLSSGEEAASPLGKGSIGGACTLLSQVQNALILLHIGI